MTHYGLWIWHVRGDESSYGSYELDRLINILVEVLHSRTDIKFVISRVEDDDVCTDLLVYDPWRRWHGVLPKVGSEIYEK